MQLLGIILLERREKAGTQFATNQKDKCLFRKKTSAKEQVG